MSRRQQILTVLIAVNALAWAIWGQGALAERLLLLSAVLYGGALVLWLGVLWLRVRPAPPLEAAEVFSSAPRPDLSVRLSRGSLLMLSLVAAGLTIGHARDNFFTLYEALIWVLSGLAFFAAFGEPIRPARPWQRWGIHVDGIRLDWITVVLWGALGLGVLFRFWGLAESPAEISLDQAQNLVDLRDLLMRHWTPLFFTRNYGREPLQFYWTAGLILLTGMPLGAWALKVGTATAGLLTLPGVYLAAREGYGRRVGVWAMLFAAVASWPVWISRLGLRCHWGTLASAWTLYFLLRSARTGRRNDFLALGICLGLGLYGYLAFRVMPLAVVCAWLVMGLADSRGAVRRSLHWRNLALTVGAALVVFVPLGAFMAYYPALFWSRSSWYATEHAASGSPLLILLDNLKNLALMFNWRGDSHPMTALPGEPALDPFIGGLFILGIAAAVFLWLRGRDARTPGLLVAGMIGLLPSALVLSFPGENPSVVRAGCGLPVVLILAALPPGLVTTWVPWGLRRMRRGAVVGALLLAAGVIGFNADRALVRQPASYRAYIYNLSEVADAIHSFTVMGGRLEDAYVIVPDGWFDDNALAFELGIFRWEHTLEDPQAAARHDVTHARLYVLYTGDESVLETLVRLFPRGEVRLYESQWGRNFRLYQVPAVTASGGRE